MSHTYIQKLMRQFAVDASDVVREERVFGPATFERLWRAQEETRKQKELGWLRSPRRWKTAEFKVGDARLPFPPAQANSNQKPPDYNAIHMANIRANAERARINRMRIPRRRRW